MSEQKLLTAMLGELYNEFEGSESLEAYTGRHGVNSEGILTVFEDKVADALLEQIEDRIRGKTVVEIGGGIGLLALHMGLVAKRVYCVEANPLWAWTFAAVLLQRKSRNVSFMLGAADEFVGAIRGDVAVYCTHSDVKGMGLVAAQFAPVVIDVWGEIIAENPQAFDPMARKLRAVS